MAYTAEEWLEDNGWWLSLILGAIIVCAGGYAITYRSEYKTYVHDMSWERHIIVEQYRTIIEESTYLPPNARELDRWTEVERYVCGTDSDGDTKYCYRSDTHYEYEIDKWIYHYTLRSNGSNREPYWPNSEDIKNSVGDIKLGDQRLGQWIEYYYLYFSIDGKTLVYTTQDKNEWLSFEIEYNVIIERNVLGSITEVRHD